MALSLSQLTSAKRKKRRRVGRGDGSGRGTYSGRGMKGQRSRSGGKKNLKCRGLKQVLQKFPKTRGFESARSAFETVNTSELNTLYKDGAIVSIASLKTHGVINGRGGGVKILFDQPLDKKLHVQAHHFSKNAEHAITKAGGSVERKPHARLDNKESKKKTKEST